MNVTSSRCQYLPSYSAAAPDSPTRMCRRHSLADCVAGLEVMAPPILFYLTQWQTYSCLLVVGLPTGSYLDKSEHTLSNTAQFKPTVTNVRHLPRTLTTAGNSTWPNHLAWGLALLVMRSVMMRGLGRLPPHSCVAPAIKAATDAPWVSSQDFTSSQISHPSDITRIPQTNIPTHWIQHTSHVISWIHHSTSCITWICSHFTRINCPDAARISGITWVNPTRITAWVTGITPI